jgi:hypothetical protein
MHLVASAKLKEARAELNTEEDEYMITIIKYQCVYSSFTHCYHSHMPKQDEAV